MLQTELTLKEKVNEVIADYRSDEKKTYEFGDGDRLDDLGINDEIETVDLVLGLEEAFDEEFTILEQDYNSWIYVYNVIETIERLKNENAGK